MNKGLIHQIIGPVVDVKFDPEELPKLNSAIEIDANDRKVVAEVAQHMGDDVVRCVALSSTDGLSRGMKQRLCLARCMIHDPKLLILDEPASGLDPRARYEFKEIIRQLRKEGRTIMISSHILSDLSEMCTNICIIDEGRCVMEGSVDEIEYHMITASPLVIRTAGRQEDAIRLIRQNEMVETLSYNENEIQAVFKGEREDEVMLLHELMAADIPVYSFGRDRSSLETLFMQITDREVKEHAHESGL